MTFRTNRTSADRTPARLSAISPLSAGVLISVCRAQRTSPHGFDMSTRYSNSTCSIRVSTSAFERIVLIQRIDFLRTLENSRSSIERLPPPPPLPWASSLKLFVLLILLTGGASLFDVFEVETPAWRKALKWLIVIVGTVGLYFVVGHWAILFPIGLCLAGDSTASGGGTPRGQSDVAPGGAW